MIQRKQTVFLILAFVLTVGCMFTQMASLQFVFLILSALLSVVTIFMYNKRKLQAHMCLLNIANLLIWYLLLAVQPQPVNGMMHIEWTAALPAVCIILQLMARKGILADEKLVRSLDRIR